jgi:hypothetical protein
LLVAGDDAINQVSNGLVCRHFLAPRSLKVFRG